MATEYTVVHSQYGKEAEFFAKIEELLKAGWSLQGGVSTSVIPIGAPQFQGGVDLKTGRFQAGISFGVVHAQALVK